MEPSPWLHSYGETRYSAPAHFQIPPTRDHTQFGYPGEPLDRTSSQQPLAWPNFLSLDQESWAASLLQNLGRSGGAHSPACRCL